MLGLALTLAPVAGLAQEAGAPAVAVDVPAGALEELRAACVSQDACVLAIQALVAQLTAANPGVPVASILGSVAATVAEAYNSGALPAAVVSVALSATASVAEVSGVTQLATAIEVAIAAVEAGEPIDTEAVAEGSGSPA